VRGPAESVVLAGQAWAANDHEQCPWGSVRTAQWLERGRYRGTAGHLWRVVRQYCGSLFERQCFHPIDQWNENAYPRRQGDHAGGDLPTAPSSRALARPQWKNAATC